MASNARFARCVACGAACCCNFLGDVSANEDDNDDDDEDEDHNNNPNDMEKNNKDVGSGLQNFDELVKGFVPGDGCFYIGMGGKGQLPNPSYQPYQCCPKPPMKASKIAKLQPKLTAKQVTSKPSTPKPSKKSEPAPLKMVSKANHPIKTKEGREKNPAPVPKGEKGKGKKGFFGTA